MRVESLSTPEKLIDGSYGVLCMILDDRGLYRSMARFDSQAKALRFYSSIPEFHWHW